MKKHIYLDDLTTDYKNWNSELSLYEDELKTFNELLAEVSNKNSSKEIKAMVEHYQNNFILHQEAIDKIKNEIDHHQHNLASEVQKSPVATQHKYYEDHTGLRGKMDVQQSIFLELKNKFREFLAERM